MGIKNYTTPLSGSCEIHDPNAGDGDLNLPAAENFRALPPLVSIVQMMERSRQLRRCFPSGLASNEERWRSKTKEAFHL
jgi:hypothetical protein